MLWMILMWLVFGLVVGALARLIVPGNPSLGLFGTVALGIVGSFAGGFLGNLLTGEMTPHLHAAGFIGSIVGATLLLAIATMVQSRRAHP